MFIHLFLHFKSCLALGLACSPRASFLILAFLFAIMNAHNLHCKLYDSVVSRGSQVTQPGSLPRLERSRSITIDKQESLTLCRLQN